MKYNHDFQVIEAGDAYRIYQSGNNIVRLDRFKNGIRVALYKKDAYIFPTFSVCPGESIMQYNGRSKLSVDGFSTTKFDVSAKDGMESFKIGDVDISIELHNFRMHYYKNGRLLFEDREYISYNFENELGEGSYHALSRYEDEEIFGLGDKTGSINKNKRHFRMETSDSMGYDANSSDPLYKQIPFYICKNKVGTYAIYYDTYSNGDFDFGQELNNYYGLYKSFKCEEDTLVFYVMFGTVESLVHDFAYMCGRQIIQPKWALKYCGSTMTYTDAPDTDKQLRNFVELCKKYNLDCGGFYLSSGYTQIGEKRYVFNWNLDKVPNPQELADYFRKNGIEFIPNIKPAFLTDHFLYKTIAEKGWFLHYQDGSPATFPFWSGMGSYLDFTNRDAAAFWTDCVKNRLVSYGYENIWNDNNEYDIHDDEVLANGFGHPIKAKLIRPLFSHLMTRASLEALPKEKRHASISRSGIPGIQRIASTWSGDNNTSWEDFRGNHHIAMTMSLSGLFNIGQDIGGFAGPRPDKELFMRWIQYGIFTPRFVLHSWNPDNIPTMPWLYEDMIPSVQKLFALRKRLLPYLYDAVMDSVNDYKPIIYPIFLKNDGYDIESDNYFFGDSIIACPVFDKGQTKVKVILPKNNGGWYLGRKRYQGSMEVESRYDCLPPYFIKGGSIIPCDEDGLTLYVYPLDEGEFAYNHYEDDWDNPNGNKTISKIKVNCNDSEVTVVMPTTCHAKVTLIDSKNRKLSIK